MFRNRESRPFPFFGPSPGRKREGNDSRGAPTRGPLGVRPVPYGGREERERGKGTAEGKNVGIVLFYKHALYYIDYILIHLYDINYILLNYVSR